MKKTMILLALSATAVLLLAPAAIAQSALPQTPSYLQPNITNTPGQGLGGYDQQLFGTPDVPEVDDPATASPDATANPTATASPEASPSASPAATASPSASPGEPGELPDTGGPSPGAPLAVAAALVLLASGLAAARLVRARGDAS